MPYDYVDMHWGGGGGELASIHREIYGRAVRLL